MTGWRNRGRKHERIELDIVPMLADGDAFDRFLAQTAQRLVELRKVEEDRARAVAAGKVVSILRNRGEEHDPYEEVHATARMLDTLFQRDGETWLYEIQELAEDFESTDSDRGSGQLRVVYVDLEPKNSVPGS